MPLADAILNKCLPNLMGLDILGTQLSEDAMEILVGASPNLRCLDLDLGVAHPPVLPSPLLPWSLRLPLMGVWLACADAICGDASSPVQMRSLPRLVSIITDKFHLNEQAATHVDFSHSDLNDSDVKLLQYCLDNGAIPACRVLNLLGNRFK